VVYPGAEISAREGERDVHVIGLGLEREVRPWQSVAKTVEEILTQGAVPLLPHPRPEGCGRPSYGQILALDVPVAVEVYNAGVADLMRIPRRGEPHDWNAGAARFYEEHAHRFLGAVGGTDAHFRTIGRGMTAYEGDLLDAIRERETAVIARPEREQLMPWDPVGYWRGLKRMARRREGIWGPRPR
jgi:predicted metal-dependent phosphoesterase TrpH